MDVDTEHSSHSAPSSSSAPFSGFKRKLEGDEEQEKTKQRTEKNDILPYPALDEKGVKALWNKATAGDVNALEEMINQYYFRLYPFKISKERFISLDNISTLCDENDRYAYYVMRSFSALEIMEQFPSMFKRIGERAAQGNVDAQYNLGLMYRKGMGISSEIPLTEEARDFHAVQWYTKAALKGHVIAQYDLGWMYEVGRGVTGEKCPENQKKAVESYKQAALSGHSEAQARLGLCYLRAQGVEKDLEAAIYWITKGKKCNKDIKDFLFSCFQISSQFPHGDLSDQKVEDITAFLTGQQVPAGLASLEKKYTIKSRANSSEEGNLLAIPALHRKYESISQKINDVIKSIEELKNVTCGFMIYPQSINSSLESLRSVHSRGYSSFFTITEIDHDLFLTFEKKNVERAHKLCKSFNDIKSIRKELNEVAGLFKMASENALARLLEQQYFLNGMKGDSSRQEEFLKKSKKFDEHKASYEKFAAHCEETEKEITETDLLILKKAQEKAIALVTQTARKRNAEFLKQYPVYNREPGFSTQ